MCAGRPDVGPRFFKKQGRFGVHVRAGSGPTRVSHYKLGISEEKRGNNRIGQKS